MSDAYEAYLRELESGVWIAKLPADCDIEVDKPAPKLVWWKRAVMWLRRRVS